MKPLLHLQLLALAFGVGALLSMSTLAPARAETEDDDVAEFEEEIVLDEVVVTGSRAQARSVTESAVPIDVVSSEEFVKQGGTDLPDLLRNIVPSYNVNTQPISDAGTVVRPPNLRSLPPDHALVLVNGKRRHRASVIHWLGNGVADGAQGPDLSAIPAIALKRVEVLRDGASAQYGSDAIAGVLNFQLRDAHEGISIETKTGSFMDGDGKFLGDGELFGTAANIGLGNESAWANLSLEYGNTGATVRSVQRNDAAALEAAGNLDVANPAQIWGQPYIRDDIKFFANYGADLGENLDFYGHANYASKETEGGFYFRNPHTRSGVFKGPEYYIPDEQARTAGRQEEWMKFESFKKDGVDYIRLPDGTELERAQHEADIIRSLLVGDLDGVDQGSECAGVLLIDNKPEQDGWLRVRDDPNCFSFLKMFPGGFTPRFGAFTTDESLLLGLQGYEAGVRWDLSASYGRHEADYFIFNTVNASMGPETPTYFDPGTYVQSDVNLNFDVAYPVSENLLLAAGLERRTETFEIVKGQIESYIIGQPLASQGFQPATNGFAGFSPVAAGIWDRANSAVYVESDFFPMQQWLLSLALRTENFDDFGTTANYKLATNYGITDDIKVRGSYSTGFRAPTPGQQNAFNITTEFNFEKNDLVNNGTVPSTSAAAEFYGGEPLDAEKSVNLSAGVVADMGVASATIDFFDITVEDRLTISQDFALTEGQRAQLIAEGITSAAGLQEFRFFTNAFDSGTSGVDVVVSAPVGKGMVSLAYNYTTTEISLTSEQRSEFDRLDELLSKVEQDASSLSAAEKEKLSSDVKALDAKLNPLNTDRVRELESNLPKQRGNLTLTQSLTSRWGVLGRASYFGSWYDSEDDYTYDGKVLVDLETSMAFGGGASSIAIGAQNILNTYPDENPNAAASIGNTYSQFSPFGFGGAFWYVKYKYSM